MFVRHGGLNQPHRLFPILLLATIARLSAQPAITAVMNAASNIAPGLPNAGIAQGAIFVVQGSGLGPASMSIAPMAFQSANLSGTSVAVMVGGATENALMYYTSDAQVAALLPSNTPTGAGTVAVTYNGQTSDAAPIVVVANNPGIFTIDSSGGGPGIVTYADYSLVSPVRAANCGEPNTTCGAANPGDTLSLWATGLGPVSGDDASGSGLGQAIHVPLTVWLGGVRAPVSYQGRSGCCIGEDQIVFTVPDDVLTGCAVPLIVQVGNEISNSVAMPVAIGSRSCTPTRSGLSSIGPTDGPITSGSITLAHLADGGDAYEDDAGFEFLKLVTLLPGMQPFVLAWVDDQPAGSCIVYNNLNASFGVPIADGTLLDAGSDFSATGPMGSTALPVNSGNLEEFNLTGAFLGSGMYTVTGSGGADVGAFSGTIAIPEAATLVSPVNGGTATRANGMTVTWTGGSGSLEIEVNSCADDSCGSGAAAVCHVPASLGTFTIPPYAMLALPAGNNAGIVLSSYSAASFTAAGLNAGTISAYSNVAGFGYGWGSGSFTLK